MSTYHIDPDIRKAETLPAEFYTRDDVFAASKDFVFSKSWQWVGHAPTQLPQNGSVAPITLLCGMIDEPVDQASVKLMKLKDAEDQITISSAIRERCMARMDEAARYSRAKSRDETESSELRVGPSKSRAVAVISRSSG